MKKKYLLLISISTLALIIDQWTKSIIHNGFKWGESINVLDSIFALTYVRNSGAAFGFMHQAPAYIRDPFFIIVPVLALFIIAFFYIRLKDNQIVSAVSLSLILGGAIGNLIDRLRFGYVIDFLDFHWREVYHWPAFNIADSCIVVGVSLMFIQSFFQGKICVDDASRPGSSASVSEK